MRVVHLRAIESVTLKLMLLTIARADIVHVTPDVPTRIGSSAMSRFIR